MSCSQYYKFTGDNLHIYYRAQDPLHYNYTRINQLVLARFPAQDRSIIIMRRMSPIKICWCWCCYAVLFGLRTSMLTT